jgi:serine/threonine-protein kinase
MTHPEKIGRYEIEAELGHGAMGSVYKARDPLMDRTIAIKTILASALAGPQSGEYRERFLREARAAGRIAHAGIVAVYDVGEHDGTPYLVMEYVPGRTLASALDAGERFPFERIYELGQQMAEALGFAHAHGVIHRDIKPANILLHTPPGQSVERAKIADFGVARLSGTQMTQTGQLLGTPSFMPPEQFTGAPIDGRSDIFSLGVILYQMVTGDKPFPGDTLTAVSYKVVHTEPVPPRRINPAVPADLERVVMRCLEKDPARRYPTGEALASDFASLRAGLPPSGVATTVMSRPAAAPPPPASAHFDPEATQDVHAPRSAQSGAGAAALPPTIAVAPEGARPRRQWPLYALVAVMAVTILAMLSSRRENPGDRSIDSAAEKLPDAAARPDANSGKGPAAETLARGGPNPQADVGAKGEKSAKATPAAPGKAPVAPQVPGLEALPPDFADRIRKEVADATKSSRWAEEWAKGMDQRRDRRGGEPLVATPPGLVRLRVDASELPRVFSFKLLVDGQELRAARGGPGVNHPVYENQFVLPGTHHLQISFDAAGVAVFRPLSLDGTFPAGQDQTLKLTPRGRVVEAKLTPSEPATGPRPPAAASEPAFLTIEAAGFPAGAQFVLVVDGKPYGMTADGQGRVLHQRAPIPAGSHEFRAHLGPVGSPPRSALGSNAAQGEFTPQQERKLKLEYQTRGNVVLKSAPEQQVRLGRIHLTLE